MSDEKTVELIREISIQMQSDPEAKKRFMNTVLGNPTADVSRALASTEKPSYYKKEFADEVKPMLDVAIKDREDIEFRYEDYPRINKRTLYLKIYWGWKYLIDFMDEDARYLKLRNDTQLGQKRNGVRITFLGIGAPLIAHKVSKASVPVHRRKIDEFVNTGVEGQELLIEKISLGVDDIADIQASLANIEGLVYIVTSTRVKLMKVSVEQWQKWMNQQ